MKNTNTTRTWKRMLALLAAVAALLTMFVLPASAKSADGFQYYVDGPYEDDGEAFATITGHKTVVNGTLTIPAKLGGNTVSSVSDGAFAGRKDITKVVISDGVGYIGGHAFEDCTNLRTLVIGDAYVSMKAFAGCKSLKKVKITAYKNEFDPEWGWEETGNDALFNADVEWTHYKKDFDTVYTEVNTRVGRVLTLTAEYDKLKNGESYHWSGNGAYPEGDSRWEDCTGKSVNCVAGWEGEATVVCDVVNSKGDVVWSQEFSITARESLKEKAQSFVRNTYLYGVTEYTRNHIRWTVMDILDKMGVDVYGGEGA